jgi:hypothetical protein
MPASSAAWMMRVESSWSVLPQVPNIIVPMQSFETWTPVRPRGRYSMSCSCSGAGEGRQVASNFYPDRLVDLIDHNGVTHAVNQIETHPACCCAPLRFSSVTSASEARAPAARHLPRPPVIPCTNGQTP